MGFLAVAVPTLKCTKNTLKSYQTEVYKLQTKCTMKWKQHDKYAAYLNDLWYFDRLEPMIVGMASPKSSLSSQKRGTRIGGRSPKKSLAGPMWVSDSMNSLDKDRQLKLWSGAKTAKLIIWFRNKSDTAVTPEVTPEVTSCDNIFLRVSSWDLPEWIWRPWLS